MAKILVVDDEQPFCENLKTFLTGKGFEVETAFGGKEGLEKMKSFRPHLVLLDIRMPGLSGPEVLPRMKALDPNVPIIMVTAIDDIATAAMTIEGGAADYITKPVDLDQLHTSIQVQHVDSVG